MGAKPQGVWGRKSPSGVQGRSPGTGSGERSPPEAEEFLKQLRANFTHFWQYFTHFHLCMPMFFFRACRHHSTKSAKWGGGHLIPFAPMSASGGQLPPLPSRLCRLCDYASLSCQRRLYGRESPAAVGAQILKGSASRRKILLIYRLTVENGPRCSLTINSTN